MSKLLTDHGDCFPRDMTLAPVATGFVAAWVDSDTLRVRRFDRDAAAIERGIRLRQDVVDELGDARPWALSSFVDDTGHFVLGWIDASSQPPVAVVQRLSSDYSVLESVVLGTVDEGHLQQQGLSSRVQSYSPSSYLFTLSGAATGFVFDFDDPPTEIELGTSTSRSDLLRVGDELWSAHATDLATSPPEVRLTLERRSLDGSLLGEVWTRTHSGTAHDLRLTTAENGDHVALAWTGGIGVRYQRFSKGGTVQGDELALSETSSLEPSSLVPTHLDIIADPEGNTLVVWDEAPFPFAQAERVLKRGVSARGTVSPQLQEIFVTPQDPETDGPYFTRPSAVYVGAGEALVATPRLYTLVVDPVPCGADNDGIAVRKAPLTDGLSLLLLDGRFRVSVSYSDHINGGAGPGIAAPGSELSGAFYFFEPDNKEIEIKVLDGRTINGFFWVFAAGLSDLGYEITVEDQRTGQVRTYANPPMGNSNFVDTAAFLPPQP